MAKGHAKNFYQLEIYGRYESISNVLWEAVDRWSRRHQHLIGDQLLRAIDSVGANIAESIGRGHYWESIHHLFYGRGSLAETQHWIRRAVHLGLFVEEQVAYLRSETTVLYKQLNGYIRAQRKNLSSVERLKDGNRVQEDLPPYGLPIQEDAWSIRTTSSPHPVASSQQPVASNHPRLSARKSRARNQGA